YLPFFDIIQLPQHPYYSQQLLYICKPIQYKEQTLRNYMFIQLHHSLPSFFTLFGKNKPYPTIHHILFYCSHHQQPITLHKKY
ncbi:DUF3965 domain-containing protein, partial [Bacillus thuringiensis]|uniref:DUF3965 domain-containing protein n=1 Tax=Bacillus thuringiensis TaxID=1428 RepID=UPI0011AABDB6